MQEDIATKPLGIRELWATSIPVADLPGLWVKRAEVPAAGAGVAEGRAGALVPLEAGQTAVGGVWHRLTHLGSPRFVAVGVLQSRSLVLHPGVSNLLTYDNQLAEADWLVSLEVAEPASVYQRILREEEAITPATLSALLAAQVDPRLRSLARRYILEDLVHNTEVVTQLEGEVAVFLRTLLQNMGFASIVVRHLSFRSMEDHAVRAERLAALEGRVRDEEIRARLQEIKQEHQVRAFIARLEHEAHIEQAFREDEIAEVEQAVAQGQPAEAIAERLEGMVADKAEQAQARAEARPYQLAQTLAASAEADQAAPKKDEEKAKEVRLRRLVAFLRAAWQIILAAGAVAAIVWPQVFEDNKWRIAAAVGTLILALLGYLTAGWINTKAAEHRQNRLQAKARLQLSARKRAEADLSLRVYAVGALQRAADRAREAKSGALREGNRDLAADLREMEMRVTALVDKARTMPIEPLQPFKLGVRNAIQETARVDVEEKIVAYAEVLAATSKGLAAAAPGRMAEMGAAALELSNLIADRQRILGLDDRKG